MDCGMKIHSLPVIRFSLFTIHYSLFTVVQQLNSEDKCHETLHSGLKDAWLSDDEFSSLILPPLSFKTK